MLRQLHYNLQIYEDYLKRLRYFFRWDEKIDVEIFSEVVTYGTQRIRMYIVGTLLYLQLLRASPELFDWRAESSGRKNERDLHLLSALSGKHLFLFPAYAVHPHMATITVTTECNFRCSHCFQKEVRGIPPLSMEEIESFFNIMKGTNVTLLGIAGGEPFLYPEHIFEIIRRANKRGITTYGIVTNGFWCKDKVMVRAYLSRLKEAGFEGHINISLGIGHEPHQDITWFKNLRALSEEVMKRNVFFFSLEHVSYGDFLERKMELRKTLGNYFFRPVRIVQVGGGISHGDTLRERNVERERVGQCCCTGINLTPDKRISFCLGPASFLPEFRLSTLNKCLEADDINITLENISKVSKIPLLLNRYRGEEIYRALFRTGKIHEEFPFFCDLCIHLSKNKELLDTIHQEMVVKQ